MLLGRQATWHTQSVAHCLWKIRKICCLSPLTCFNFTTLAEFPSKCHVDFRYYTFETKDNTR